MSEILIATTNKHKLKEITDILAAEGVEGWDIFDLNTFPYYNPPEETGENFTENAIQKALSAARISGMLTLADDSGLEVDALDGAPGVISARYANDQGYDHDDAANRRKLLAEMADVADDKRQARFVCVAALAIPEGEAFYVDGSCEGQIAREEKGENGFGYDSLFYLPQLGKTMAELNEQEKNQLSHRAEAMRKIAFMMKKKS